MVSVSCWERSATLMEIALELEEPKPFVEMIFK
jgi:hypothetical protein